ncbi:MAG: YhcH/YjgK/YiaL family protein, partial [Pygmaiobacter sp.]
EKEIPSEVKIMINAGFAGSAWSGGDAWNHVRLIEKLTQWVHQGGIYFGVGEPSAQMRENGVSFQMAHVLGVDKKRDCMLCHGTWQTEKKQNAASPFEAVLYPLGTQVQISAEGTQVLAQTDAHLQATMHPFGSGKGVYFCGYRHTDANAYALLQCLQFLMGQPVLPQAVTNTPWVTCAIYPAARRAVFANSSEDVRSASVQINGKSLQCVLQAYQMKTVPLPDTEDFEEIPSPMTLAAFGQRANTHALQKALQFLSQANLAQLKPGRYAIDGDAVYASVQLYQTGFADENRYESHRNYIDVQYVISGEEQIGCAALAEMPKGAYDAANDITYYQDPPVEAQKMLCLRAGELVILPPQIAHKPCCIAKKAQPVKKVVVKVLRFHG